MDYLSPQILLFVEALIFLSVIFMHVVKKNSSAAFLYSLQSLTITALLAILSYKEHSIILLLVALLMFAVKAIIAPTFFLKLIKRHHITFSVSTYLNTPVTLIAITALTALANSYLFKPLVSLSPANESALILSVAAIFVSFFLIVNRKGAISQMIGILSLENGIVSFASLSGLEKNPGLQIGITFDISVWIIIATVFASMIYKQFGSMDVTTMKHLKEE